MQKIRREQPANRWGEALPLGNGHMGAMIYGGIQKETIEFSENTFYSGGLSDTNNQKGAATIFYNMRQEIVEENYQKAHELAEQYVGVRNNYGTNLPVGQMTIAFSTKSSSIKEYQRVLSIEEGVASCSYVDESNQIKRSAWISNPDNIMVYEITSNQACDCILDYKNNGYSGTIKYEDNTIIFTSFAHEKKHCDIETGVMLCGYIGIKSDGIIQKKAQTICILKATKTYIYMHLDTDFKEEDMNEQRLQKKVKSHVNKLMQKKIETIYQRHCEDVRSNMLRCTLRIQGAEEKAVTMIPFMFQYGRYLLLASSRENSKLPAHLQGIWNDNVACQIGWTCDMHLDINTQMNYWPAYVTNLSTVTPPLFTWLKNDVVKNGIQTALESYGLSGWVAEIVSNAWGFAAPYWAVPIAPCPTGGVWILTHMWEHYLFTKEEKFLKEVAFPIMKEATRFFVDYVFEDDKGNLTCGPSISPENSFVIDDKRYQLSNGCTYEIIMIRELFRIYINACEILEETRCNNLLEEVQEKLPRLLPYAVTKEGTIAEWNHNYETFDPQHRHTSHLLGVFPFAQITPQKTPELITAVEQTIEKKLIPLEGWEDTGWARSMLMLYEARLKHADKAYQHIDSMLTHLLEDNQFVIHPPTRGAESFDNVYELDGNTGLTACIGELLLQSHEEFIEILPALPTKWYSGNVTGICARGGVEVGITWENKKLVEIELFAKTDMEIQVKYDDQIRKIILKKQVVQIVSYQ